MSNKTNKKLFCRHVLRDDAQTEQLLQFTKQIFKLKDSFFFKASSWALQLFSQLYFLHMRNEVDSLTRELWSFLFLGW